MKLDDIKLDLPEVKGRKVTKLFGRAGGQHASKKHKKRAKQKAEFRRQLAKGDY
jgi:hypothetical protein